MKFLSAWLLLAGLLPTVGAAADEPEDDAPPEARRPNLPSPTFGGIQFWSDVTLFHDWRIQRNAVTGHCRLLDGHDKRHAWGTLGECKTKLDEIKQDRGLAPMHGKAVILLHGLIRTRKSLNVLGDHLREEGGYVVLNVGYSSTRADIPDHAANLAAVIDGLEGIEEINFVAHSLGNLVIRHYLADQTDAACGRCPDPRIRRIVMLAPPNHGSALAEMWAENALFKVVMGPSARSIARGLDQMEERLATPCCEFAILAGGRGDEQGYNPLLEGDDDGVVSVHSTQLAGAADFAIVPVSHTFIMRHPRSLEYTLRFLQEGCLVSDDLRQPLPLLPSPTPPPTIAPDSSTPR